ncbi:M15 family metallopeptidase [Sporolactobacillus sp. STCC-11]|uniref:M15 family metallopeptidase n=1 Tax=Sporolactobacillus caesalpiniae TaxID=3230362 RepID=UPI003390AC37
MNTINKFTKQDEPLVSLSDFSPKITIYPSYFLQKMPGTCDDLFLRQGVAAKILSIAERLPEGISFVLIDGWRSIQTQKFIYDRTIIQFREAGYSEEKIKKEISDFVAFPSKDPLKPAPHYTGAAVDLTLANGNDWLEMGTDFDEFNQEAYLDFYEGNENLSVNELHARDNRRFLKKMMEDAGFTHNPTEWWHYSYGDRTWAREHQTEPLYGGIERVH